MIKFNDTMQHIIIGPTSHTLVIVLSIFGVLVPISIVVIIIIVVVCVRKKYRKRAYWPRRAERNQGMELEDDKQNEESRSDSATAAKSTTTDRE